MPHDSRLGPGQSVNTRLCIKTVACHIIFAGKQHFNQSSYYETHT